MPALSVETAYNREGGPFGYALFLYDGKLHFLPYKKRGDAYSHEVKLSLTRSAYAANVA